MAINDAGAKASGPSLFASFRATLALSWPIMLTNLGQTAMTATDVSMMGRLGSKSLAAGALGSNLYFAPLIFGLGLMLATSPMIAVEIGRRRHSVRDIRRTVRQGLWLAIAVSVPIWLLLWNTQHILRLMGQDAELSAMATSYVRALQWSVLPFFAYIVLRSFISALERPGWALAVVFGAIGFNVLANWCLMFGNLGFPALALPGSGLATTLSSTMMFTGLVIAVCTDRQFRRYRLFGRFWRADWPRFAGLLGLGLPIAGLMLFEVTIFNAAAFLMGLIGADSLAAHAIAIQIASLTFMIPLGLGQAATIRVGRAFGAGDRLGIARAGWVAYALGVGFMAAMALVMLLFPRVLIGAFIDLDAPENAGVVRIAVGFLAFAALFQIVDGAQAVSSGMLRGLNDTKVPMLFAALGYWGVGMPLGALLAFHFELGGNGIWIGLFSGLAAVATLLLLRWLRRDRLLAGMP